MKMASLEIFRTAAIITLLVLLVVILWKRLRRWMLLRDVPVPQHAEVRDVTMEYHPARLRMEVRVPQAQTLHLQLLDEVHAPLAQWPDMKVEPGRHVLTCSMEGRADGTYHVEVRTTTQRTVRRFRLQQA